MAINRQQKEAYVAEYAEKLGRAEAAFLTDYRGLTVREIGALREQLREEGDAELAVAKNTLLRIALEQSDRPVPDEALQGPTAILFCYDDPISPAKVLKQFADRNDVFSIKGGILGDRVVDIEEFERLAALPSREVILATLIGTIGGPAQELFSTITAPAREIAQVLHARSESDA